MELESTKQECTPKEDKTQEEKDKLTVFLLSDIHGEFYKSSKEVFEKLNLDKLPVADICILAGDIGHPLIARVTDDCKFTINLTWLHVLKTFKKKYKHVLFVPGNHEYYQACDFGASISEINDIMKTACLKHNIVFLNCESWKVPECPSKEFFGCTLWSLMLSRTWMQMNDSRAFAKHQEFVNIHIQHVTWLSKSLKESKASQKYIITHYLPSFDLIHPRFAESQINDGFACNLNHLFKDKSLGIHGWFYGHTHEHVNRKIEEIPTYCNPLGYPQEARWTTFSYNSIEIPTDHFVPSNPGSCPVGTNLVQKDIVSHEKLNDAEKQRLALVYQKYLLGREKQQKAKRKLLVA